MHNLLIILFLIYLFVGHQNIKYIIVLRFGQFTFTTHTRFQCILAHMNK